MLDKLPAAVKLTSLSRSEQGFALLKFAGSSKPRFRVFVLSELHQSQAAIQTIAQLIALPELGHLSLAHSELFGDLEIAPFVVGTLRSVYVNRAPRGAQKNAKKQHMLETI